MAVIRVERSVAQVVVDRKYEGYVSYLGTRLDFTIEFPGGLTAFSSAEPASIAEVKELVLLSLSKDKEALVLDDDEYVQFVLLIAPDVWEFANHSQTKATNESSILNRLTKMGIASVEASMTFENDYEVEESHLFLNPKFGAKLPVE